MSKQFLGVLVAIVLVFVGIFVFGGNKTPAKSSGTGTNTPTSHIEGLGQDNVTLVEYGDYECPYCEEYFPVVQQVQTEFNSQMFFQFRNFPLVNVHQNAFAGARAAEAAGLEGKFWQMHDALYDSSNWQVWSTATDPTPYFDEYASQLGLNVTQFKSDFASSKVNNLVNADMAAGNALNIQGTPTFFLDGKEISVAPTTSAFEKVINAEIAKKAPTKN